MIDFVVEEIARFLKDKKKGNSNSKILVAGLAFKGDPVTSDIRGSTAFRIINFLREQGFSNIHGLDPAVRKEDLGVSRIKFAADPKEAFRGADVILVTNNNPYFESLDMRSLICTAKKPVFLFDTWGIYNEDEILKVKGVVYRRL